jgi:hypothetical protein
MKEWRSTIIFSALDRGEWSASRPELLHLMETIHRNTSNKDLSVRIILDAMETRKDRLCGLVVIVPGYKSIGPGSIPCATRFSEK